MGTFANTGVNMDARKAAEWGANVCAVSSIERNRMRQLVTKTFERQALAFPEKVDQALAKIETVEQAKDLLDKAAAMHEYSKRLKVGIRIERPIAIGVIKIKAKLGELMPAGKIGAGRGNKTPKPVGDFSPPTVTAYRKLAKHRERFEDYVSSHDDVPTQTDFLRWCNGADVHVARNSGQNEWYTPSELIESARTAMGSIDLDPASSEIAQDTVGAKEYFTVEDDGLSKSWYGNVWLNPPYSADLVGRFVAKLREDLETGAVEQAVLLVNNATETAWFQRIGVACDAMCLLAGRVQFLDSQGNAAKSPLQGQAVMYFGRRVKTFMNQFSRHGLIFVR